MSGTYTIEYPGLGTVVVTHKPQARRFIARWKGSTVTLTAPVMATKADVARALATLQPQLIAGRPAPLLGPDTVIVSPSGFRFEVREGVPDVLGPPDVLKVTVTNDVLVIYLPKGYDFASVDNQRHLSSVLAKAAAKVAPKKLMPEVMRISREIGVAPDSWRVGRGAKVLGTCSARRVITISAFCMFLTPGLLRYIVAHELAHLTHMNHSADFHRLCNRYLDGAEARLASQLRAYPWPLLRQ